MVDIGISITEVFCRYKIPSDGCRPQDLVTLGGVEVGGGEEVAEDVPLVLPGVVVPGASLPQVTVPLE